MLQNKTVTIIYKAWTNGTGSGEPNYTGVAQYINVNETDLVVAIGTDACSIDGEVSAHTESIVQKTAG